MPAEGRQSSRKRSNEQAGRQHERQGGLYTSQPTSESSAGRRKGWSSPTLFSPRRHRRPNPRVVGTLHVRGVAVSATGVAKKPSVRGAGGRTPAGHHPPKPTDSQKQQRRQAARVRPGTVTQPGPPPREPASPSPQGKARESRRKTTESTPPPQPAHPRGGATRMSPRRSGGDQIRQYGRCPPARQGSRGVSEWPLRQAGGQGSLGPLQGRNVKGSRNGRHAPALPGAARHAKKGAQAQKD